MISRLVSFDTTSRNSNLELIAFVRDYLSGHGIESTLVPSPEGDKASLFATIGPKDVGGVALSGHTDCVPVDGQAWTTDPFAVVEKDGRLYGRGTADMKGFVAIALAMVPTFAEKPLSTPIHLALSYDEEVGCTGARPMIGELGGRLPMPIACIVGEPTRMAVVDAHKTITDYLTEVTGHEAHSAHIDKGASAILAGAGLLMEIARMRDDMIAAGDPSGRFDPPYTTLHVGRIHGGTSHNIVPLKCKFEWEVRSLPGVDPETLRARFERFAAETVLPKLRAVAPTTDIVTEMTGDVMGLAPVPGSLAETLAMRFAGRNKTEAVSYATEAGLFQVRGIPSIICGPGDIAQAHQPDEFLDIAQIDACVAFMQRLTEAARAGI
jgi:acetylornithine deacetylase